MRNVAVAVAGVLATLVGSTAAQADNGPDPIVYDVEIRGELAGELVVADDLRAYGRDVRDNRTALVQLAPLFDVMDIEGRDRAFSWGSELALTPDVRLTLRDAELITLGTVY